MCVCVCVFVIYDKPENVYESNQLQGWEEI